MTPPSAAALLLLLWCGAPARAQEPELLTWQLLLERHGELLAPPPAVCWIPGGHDAAFALEGAIGRRSPGAAEAPMLIEARTVLERLGIEVPDGQPAPLPPWSFHDAVTLRVVAANAVWHLPLDGGDATRVLSWPDVDERDLDTPLAIAPGDARVAYASRHDLHVAGREGTARRITWDGGPDLVYGGAAHRAEFGIRSGLLWSDGGRWLAFYREDQREVAPYPYQDLAADPPAPRAGRYPMAGGPHARVQVGVYDALEQSLCWLEHDPAQDLYWTNITFAPDDRTLTVALVSRGQDRMELVRFDRRSGKRLATLLTEHDAEWIEPEHGPTFLPDGRFLWWSPRDGHRHLWLHDADGTLLGQVTKGAFDVQDLLGVATDGSQLWFSASGEDPRQLHLFAAKLDGSEVRQLTRKRGTHSCMLSPDRRYAFDVWSNLETPPQPRFLDLATGAVEELAAPPPQLAGLRLPAQRLFQVKADDDAVLYGHLLLPRELPEGERLPVLLYVYGGPHVQLVTDSWLASASPWLHALANEGYVVCRLDNRGTPHRGIEWEQSVFRRLGTLEVQDQLRAVEWLQKQPFVDPGRIAVHGWSYGGYLTLRLLLEAPGTFACGISGAPVTDWALYETGYTERYMDTPAENPDGYREASCLLRAAALQDPLLIVHGTDDRTVMWAHTLRFVDRCVAAGRHLEYFPYPQQRHRLEGPHRLHFQRMFKDHLDRWLAPRAGEVREPAEAGSGR